MKLYPSITGYSKYIGQNCIAFDKKDGSNLRFEYNRKSGWSKFGTRTRLFDKSDPDFGEAIEIFMNVHSENLRKIFVDKYKNHDTITVFCEFLGKNSFAGLHIKDDPKSLFLFDVEIHKKGFISPREFNDNFVNLPYTTKVVYEGKLTEEYIQSVKEAKLIEGVVCKGFLAGKKESVHNLWMAKIKTNWWLEEVKKRSIGNEQLQKVLSDNLREQSQ